MSVLLAIYTRHSCHLCDVMKAAVREVAAEVPLSLEEVDVDRSPALAHEYGRDVPVLFVEGREIARHRVTVDALRTALRDRQAGPHRP